MYSFYSVYVLIVDFYNYYSECCLCAVPASSAITVQVAQFSDYVQEMQQEDQGGNKFVKEFEVSDRASTYVHTLTASVFLATGLGQPSSSSLRRGPSSTQQTSQ